MSLSNSEQNVRTYLEQGLSNYDIANKLCVTEKTIKFHLTNIYKKLGVKTRAELIAKKYESEDNKIKEGIMKTINPEALPSPQDKRNMALAPKSQEDKIQFIDDKFKVGSTIDQLHNMMKEVTKEEINPSTVNAACNCVARLNETINTAIQAARFLNER